MPHKNSLYPLEWIRFAEKDFERAERLLKQNDPGLAGFCLQQAVEKFLKAFLLSRGGDFGEPTTWQRFCVRRQATNPAWRSSGVSAI